MSVELTPVTIERRSWWTDHLGLGKRSLLDVVVVVVAFAAAGTICGLIWKSSWHAQPGVAFEHKWYLEPEGMPDDFSGTGIYVIVALIGGLVVATVLALVIEHDEIVTLGGVVVGSVLAAWLMYAVGHRLGPPDPRVLAASAQDYDPLPSDLRVHGPASFMAFPLGAAIGLGLVYFLFGRRGTNAPTRPAA